MIPLSRRSLLAVVAVLDVALHARPLPVSARALAARLELAPRNLESVLQALVRGGILKGVRGPKGGYEVARERRRVSVGDIVRAVATRQTPSGSDEPDRAQLIDTVVAPALAAAGERYLAELGDITLADLCERAGGTEPSAGDFTI